ncbi:MAG: LCP family protein [Lachnospiraceae bacterium]|nr:LCP family protein [Lachnospiraceae bacterium]
MSKDIDELYDELANLPNQERDYRREFDRRDFDLNYDRDYDSDYDRGYSERRFQNTGRSQAPRKRSDGRRRKKRRDDFRPIKIGALSHILFFAQLAASVAAFGSMAVLGILPMSYMAGLLILLIILLVIVKLMQKRAVRYGKRRVNGRWTKKSTGKWISLVTAALLCVFCFYGLKVNKALDQIAIGEESGKYAEEKAIDVTEKPFNVYVSGIDVYGNINKKSRSDVNLIATINPKTHKILLTTTPRDYYVTIPGVSGEQKDKLTHAGVYGIDTSIATLANLYDTEIPFFVRVNFSSVRNIVDIMGGVDVESELAFTTGRESGAVVDVKKGMNHFNGKQALAFVRERHALAAGDNQRGKNQQALLTALIHQAMSPKMIINANSIINRIAGSADTNMSEAQIKSLIRMQLGSMKGWEVKSVAAEGDSSGKQYCYSYKAKPLYVTVPNEESVTKIKKKMRRNMR